MHPVYPMVLDHIDGPALSVEVALRDGLRLELRRRVCRNDTVWQTVNQMLASVQNTAQATYRAILERRAKDNGLAFAKAVGTALTPMAFYETVTARSYEAVVAGEAPVDVRAGIVAADRLQRRLDAQDGQSDLEEIKRQVNPLIRTVWSTAPKDVLEQIVEKIKGLAPMIEPPQDDDHDDEDWGDEEFNPIHDDDLAGLMGTNDRWRRSCASAVRDVGGYHEGILGIPTDPGI